MVSLKVSFTFGSIGMRVVYSPCFGIRVCCDRVRKRLGKNGWKGPVMVNCLLFLLSCNALWGYVQNLQKQQQSTAVKHLVVWSGCWCRCWRCVREIPQFLVLGGRDLWCVWVVSKQYPIRKQAFPNNRTARQPPTIFLVLWTLALSGMAQMR